MTILRYKETGRGGPSVKHMFDSGCFSLPLEGCGACAGKQEQTRPEAPSAHCPLTMLGTVKKLREKLIIPRLADAMRDAGDYLPTQYNFRVGGLQLMRLRR